MKNRKINRLLSLLAAGAMAMSMMSTTVYAQETTGTGTIWYGDELSVDVTEGENGYTFLSVNKEVASYYEASNHIISAPDNDNWNAIPYLFIMLDTTNEYENIDGSNIWKPDGLYSFGQSNYEVLYCCDVLTGYEDGIYYKRVNLEDSDYYDSEAAAHIRAILTNSYPYVSVDEMKADLVEAEVYDAVNLTRSEIIAAVQAAIWSYSNDEEGDWYEYLKTYHLPKKLSWGRVLHDFTNEMAIWWKQNNSYSENEEVGKRINELSAYLKNLSGVYVEDKEIVISDINIVESAPVKGENDLFNVALKVALNNSGSGEKDDIKLEVYIDDVLETSSPIEFGTEEYTFNVAAKMGQTIKAVVSGIQNVPEGVYFYEPEGGRHTSQCLVGVGAGETDVYAEASVALQERILQFHKKTEVDNVQYPLEGIEFEIYYVSSVEDYNKDLSEILSNQDATDDKKYDEPTMKLVEGQEPIATVITDASGNASYNLTQNNKPDGIYLIVEKEHDAISETLAPFLIAVPMVDKDGYPVYNMNLNLKNNVVRPEVDKDVTAIDQKEDTLNVGEEVTWIIRGDIPADIAKAKLYKLTDELDYRLTYIGNLVVKVEEIADEADNSVEGEAVLVENEDYILTVTDGTIDVNPDEAVEEPEETKTIVVELTKAGRTKIADMVATDSADYELRVYFNTYIDEDAEVGTDIPNTVDLEYKNSANFVWNVEPEEDPVVYTCGINLYKYDTKDISRALAGAVFKLARKVDQSTEGATPLVTKEDETIYVVYEDFYTAIDAETGELTAKANTVTTTSDGDAMLYGLAEGTYYLVEIQAPSGYNMLSYPEVITLNKSSHLANNTVKVANSNQFKLPETGGIGTTIFTVSGMMMLAAAVVVLVMKKKREEA